VVALTPADVKRWDPDAIHAVFQTASNRAATLQRLGESLRQVHNTLCDWHGDAGDAFRADLGKTRRDIDADGQESTQVAAAVSVAEADVRAVKSELDGIQQAADGYGFTISPDWRIEAGMGAIGFDTLTLAAEEQLLQGQLDTCKLHAHNADQELANAVRGAVGDAPVSAGAPAPDTPKTWQDMLLPAGPASAQPGGDPAKGPPVPDGTYKPPSLEDMMLGRGQPADQKPPDLLSQLKPPTVPPQQLDPADIERFKALARPSLIAEGVPPDQIEARLNAAVANTQQWIDAGMPKYVAPPPPKPPAPGFGEGFGDRWNSSIEGIQNLVGANGLDAMGDAWGGTAKGLAGKAEEYLTLGPVVPFADAAGEVKSFMDNPSYYLGEKAADGALSAPAMMFGPEGAGIGELGEAGAAGAIARDLPGMHPPVSPLEQLLPDLHAPPSPLETPMHEGFHPSGPTGDPLAGFIDPQGPPGGPLSAGVHPSGPVDAPAPAGSAGHPWSEPAEVVAPAGHPPPDAPGTPTHSELPAAAGHVPASEEAPLGAGHAPDSAKVPVAAGHVSSPAEAHAPASHVPSGPPEPPVSGGHGGSGPPEYGGHGGSGPPEPPASGGHPSDGLPNHVPVEPNPPYIPPPESQWAPIGHDQPITYHPEASQTAVDLTEAFAHHQPTAELSQRLADMSTHYVGDNPDRVVLGKWDGNESGYIGEARGHGGIYYDTSNEVWDNVGHGLSKAEANHLGWEVNENFLRSQMERGVDRIDYVVEGTAFTSVDDVLDNDARSFSAKEIRFLNDNASSYGYERIGDSWIRVKGGQP
jgi:uncharacterized protein YukE